VVCLNLLWDQNQTNHSDFYHQDGRLLPVNRKLIKKKFAI